MVEHSSQHGLYDELDHVSGEEAVKTAQELARAEGIFTGTSGGGVLAVALRKAKSLASGASLVVMLPDTGERYLSTPLFDDIPADMTAEEAALSASAPPTVAFPQPLPEPTDEGRALVEKFVDSSAVTIVAMESCEFCEYTHFRIRTRAPCCSLLKGVCSNLNYRRLDYLQAARCHRCRKRYPTYLPTPPTPPTPPSVQKAAPHTSVHTSLPTS